VPKGQGNSVLALFLVRSYVMNYSDKNRLNKIAKENELLGEKVNKLTELVKNLKVNSSSDDEKVTEIERLEKENVKLVSDLKELNALFIETKKDLEETLSEKQRFEGLYDKLRRKAAKLSPADEGEKGERNGPRRRNKK
jgi:hypothetical protein